MNTKPDELMLELFYYFDRETPWRIVQYTPANIVIDLGGEYIQIELQGDEFVIKALGSEYGDEVRIPLKEFSPNKVKEAVTEVHEQSVKLSLIGLYKFQDTIIDELLKSDDPKIREIGHHLQSLDELFAKEMEECVRKSYSDPEMGHSDADDLLIKLLLQLGFKKTVEEWNKVEKWYA